MTIVMMINGAVIIEARVVTAARVVGSRNGHTRADSGE
jgi:hypothetical protein